MKRSLLDTSVYLYWAKECFLHIEAKRTGCLFSVAQISLTSTYSTALHYLEMITTSHHYDKRPAAIDRTCAIIHQVTPTREITDYVGAKSEATRGMVCSQQVPE